ncbi:sodium-coupled monocarboxylate transporter 1-like [Archocentrus centrarchus]|uniref:sodium-coupled monocarboxylate transporter 1-like n=1 Tax=Archocentrus centrarchus TaxID=63155 RepID=UPI0011EA04B4|nr:sodium-coupled monocarboxylate transporter 1-like [Archocentrus centrarchus]
MLLVSTGISLYCARIGRSQSNSRDFLTGGRKLTALPVSLSLTAGILSSVILLSLPVEVYCYGAIVGYSCIAYFLAQVCTSEIFLPVFYRLAITSTFQYLELRFNRATRLLATFVMVIQAVLITGLVIYAPALALNQVTGWNLWLLIFVTGMVCTICCTLGGMKAVVWINVFQIGIMFAGLMSVICKCLVLEGGISVLSISEQGGRINFLDFDLNPLRRHTFWTILIGGTVGWTMASGTNQSQVQKYNSCKSITHARIAVFLNLLSFWLFLASAVFSGLCLYSFYKNCDPWTAGQISSPDQLMPYLVMDILKGHPGLPGLFLAAVYSGTLSTVSSTLNAIVAVTLEDLIKPYIRLTDRQFLYVSRGLSICFGVVCITMAGLASLMGLLVQARAVIGGVTGGPMFGLFVLGILCPFANSKGGLFGLAFGSTATLSVTLGHMLSYSDPEMTRPLSLNTEGCNVTTVGSVNWTTAFPPQLNLSTMSLVRDGTRHRTSNWHSPSYLYFSLIGFLTTVIVGMLISIYTGGLNQRVEPRLMLMKEDTISYHLFELIKYKIKKRPSRAKQNEMEEANEGHVRMRMLHRRVTSAAAEAED